MLARAKWIVAAGALVLAVLAYGWWSHQRDKARDATLKAAHEAVAVAVAARDAARRESRRTDSLARTAQEQRDSASAAVARLQSRLQALAGQQAGGSFQSVPLGQEPEGISWRDAFFVKDSALTQSQAALFAEQQRSKLFLEDRDRYKGVVADDSVAMLRQATAIDVALSKNACHLLWIIDCPSRKAMLVTGAAAGVATTLIVTKPWKHTDIPKNVRRVGFSIRF